MAPVPCLGGANPVRSRALGTLLDLELDTLTAGKAVEIERCLKAVPMEEVFLVVLGSDEAESSIGDDTLDRSSGHDGLQSFSNGQWAGAVCSREGDHAELRHKRWRGITVPLNRRARLSGCWLIHR